MGVAPRAEAGVNVPRFHVVEAAPGARLRLPEHSAHHARDVLRLRAGSSVRVFDGRGAEYEAVLDLVAREGVTARVTGPAEPRPESPLKVSLALSPLKGDRMELVVQKATELGVVAIHPVVTARTDAVARPALKGSRQERWDKVASGAAEQCGRAVVPLVAPTVRLDEFLAEVPTGRRLLFLEVPGQPSLRTLPPVQEVVALVGPAGGWDPREAERLTAAGFQPVGLGPRVLRAETAAVAVLAALQALWGDLA
jgi:16S rRNA (uracil1498-N3)-methyltransferase